MTETLLDAEDVAEIHCHCGRRLTDPLSVARKTGPVCWEREHGTPPSRPSRRTPTAPDQQPALPLDIPPVPVEAAPTCPRHLDMEDDDPEDRHPRTDAVMIVYRALAACACVVPVDPYDPDDVGSVASEAVWSLIRAGLLPAEQPPKP